jgi:hypothetical protein
MVSAVHASPGGIGKRPQDALNAEDSWILRETALDPPLPA